MIPGVGEVPGQASKEERMFLGKGSLMCRGLGVSDCQDVCNQRSVSQAAEEEGSTSPSDPGNLPWVCFILWEDISLGSRHLWWPLRVQARLQLTL